MSNIHWCFGVKLEYYLKYITLDLLKQKFNRNIQLACSYCKHNFQVTSFPTIYPPAVIIERTEGTGPAKRNTTEQGESREGQVQCMYRDPKDEKWGQAIIHLKTSVSKLPRNTRRCPPASSFPGTSLSTYQPPTCLMPI